MSDKRLMSIKFKGIDQTYIIPTVIADDANNDGNVVVKNYPSEAYAQHSVDKANPHSVTAEQVGAAPAEIISYSFAPSAVGELDTLLKGVYDAMGQNSRKFIFANMLFNDGLSGGVWQLTLAKTTNDYGFIIAESYTTNPFPLVKTRTIYGGAWGDWYDVSASTFAPSGYGLGETSAYCADCNSVYKNGWYEFDVNTANLPTEGIAGTLFVHSIATENGTDIYQTIKSGAIVIQRYYSSWASAWQPWEYVNPPLQVGVQYRTTMRDNGKALYLQRGDNGAIFYRRDGEDAWYAMASRIDGTFANVVAANPTAQDPATRQLRNSTIVSTETTPSYNGEICWVYE